MKTKKMFALNQGQKNTKVLSKFFHFLFAFAVLGGGLFFSGEASAADYYVDSLIVDTYVNNATPDFTTYNHTTFETTGGVSSVFKTIADLNSKMGSSGFLPDDQILFRRGQTWSESLNIADSGTDGSPITFGAFGSGDNPVINRLYARDYLAGGDWTIFEDLDFSNPSGHAVDWKKYDNVIFRRINVYGSSANGVNILAESEDYPSNITIENSNIYNNAGYGIWANLAGTSTIRHVVAYNNGSSGNQNNISASPFTAGALLTIEDTTSHSAYGNGFGSAPNDASATVIFNRCKAYDNNQTGFVVHGTVPATIKIYDCLAYSNGTYGISIGSLTTNPNNSEIYNCTIENNANAGLFMQSIGSHIIKNNIIYNNGEGVPASGVQVSWLQGGATLISDNNIIAEQSQGRTIYTREISTMKTLLEWQSYSGGQYDQYSAGSNPLFISSSDYALQYLSPAIDSGTSVSLTTDYAGNNIYGTPDIGAYEYQPPYTIGTDEIDTAGDIRIYADGKFRNTVTAGGTTADLSITPSGGFGAGDYSEWMNLDIDTWNTTGTYYKKWTETSDNSSLNSAHTVGDLSASTYYTVWYTKSGEDKTRLTTAQADGSSQIAFTYDQGYSDVIFEIEEDTTAPAAFELLSPANNFSTNFSTSNSQPTLSWNASSDTESGLSHYQLYIDGALDTNNISSSAAFIAPTNNLSCGIHTWYIKAFDNAGNFTNSNTFNLTLSCGGGMPVWLLNQINQNQSKIDDGAEEEDDNDEIKADEIKEKIFAYNKPRLKSLAQEQNRAKNLKQELEKYYSKGKIFVHKKHWHTIVNSYIYGNYPIQAIIQAIKYGGKTVHPNIPFSAWQRAEDYLKWIER